MFDRKTALLTLLYCTCPALAAGRGISWSETTPCNPGYYRSGSACTACPANTNSTAGSTNLQSCICVPGYEAAYNGVQCTKCQAGREKPASGIGACTTCSHGFYSKTDETELCSQCPSGTGTWNADGVQVTGSNSLSACVCNIGYTAVSNGIECTVCGVGVYKDAIGIGQCSHCPPGSTSPPASVSLNQCKCSAGYSGTSDGVSCEPCGDGYFKSATGVGGCEPCRQTSILKYGSAGCVACLAGSTWDPDSRTCRCNEDYTLHPSSSQCVLSEERKMRPIGAHCSCD
jgi:hypothetical protein